MAHQKEEAFLRVLRWMRENIDLASSIYRTKSKVPAIDPSLCLDSEGHPKRKGTNIPLDLDSWFLNSVTGLVCCCYMDALGKIIRKGKRGYGLNTFATAHMPDLVAECDAKEENFSLHTLYKTYRCGFVHQFASAVMAWGRQGRMKDYWFSDPDDKPILNIDRLATGLVEGIGRFEIAFRSEVAAGEKTYEQFFEYLDAE